MRILGIETATSVCAVALSENGCVLAESMIDSKHVHAERLLPLIDEVLASSRLSLNEIDGVGVSIGPGSFTGLRIGLSVAKGLAYATGKPIVAVSTLEALALRALEMDLVGRATHVVPMIDARRLEVYAAVYRVVQTDHCETIVRPRAAQLKEIEEFLPDGGGFLVMGDGAEKFRAFLATMPSGYSSRFDVPTRIQAQSSAGPVARLGERLLAGGEVAELASLEPVYVKDFQTLVRTQHAPEVQS